MNPWLAAYTAIAGWFLLVLLAAGALGMAAELGGWLRRRWHYRELHRTSRRAASFSQADLDIWESELASRIRDHLDDE
jgi:hypothetical protein